MKTASLSIIIILTGAIIGCNSNDNLSEKLFAEKFEFYPNMLTDATRSDTIDPSSAPLKEIMEKYDSKNYEAALEGINKYLQENPEYYKAKFYRGLIYLKNRELENAIGDFEDVIKNNSQFKEEAEWYLSLSYIRAQRKDDAVKLLNEMKQNSRTQAARAEDLLKHISEWPIRTKGV
jgi:tetratricopeptide (TPR) repeat protein